MKTITIYVNDVEKYYVVKLDSTWIESRINFSNMRELFVSLCKKNKTPKGINLLTLEVSKTEKEQIAKLTNSSIPRVKDTDIISYIKAIEDMKGKAAGLVIVDYLQLISSETNDDFLKTTKAMQGLKEASLLLNIPKY